VALEKDVVVNGVDRSSVVDHLFQDLDLAAGRKPDTEVETTEAAEQDILLSDLGTPGSDVYRRSRQQKTRNAQPTLLPPECQGAVCHARAALVAFATACAADRACSSMLGVKQAREEKLSGEVVPVGPPYV